MTDVEQLDPAPPAAIPPRSRVPSGFALAVVGLAVGVLLAGLVVVVSGLGERNPADDLGVVPVVSTVDLGPAPTAAASERLVAAIRRSKRATFVVVEEYRRVNAGGQEIVATITTRAQRPPDSAVRTASAVEIVRGGRRTSCSSAPDDAGRLQCRSEPFGPVDVEAAVREEASLVSGPAPLYTVGEIGGGCFALVLRVERLAPPYGRRARLCYDEATGAPSSSELSKAVGDGTEIVDRTTAVQIRAEVTDTDFAQPADVVP